MCGIVGLFIKNPALEPQLGHFLSDMLIEMSDRGPDSAGVAIYRQSTPTGVSKITVMSDDPHRNWERFGEQLRDAFDTRVSLSTRVTHAVLSVPQEVGAVLDWLDRTHPALTVTSSGTRIEIYKAKGLPKTVVDRSDIRSFSGSHALGHTRMATESEVTTAHSHPFSTGLDLCLVHNGSLSNHNRLRAWLQNRGIAFRTDNDSEVAAGYVMYQMRQGKSLDQALQNAISDLDGFYTFAIGTRDGFAVMRDPISCKPAVMAETDDWAAMASEYRALACLPGADDARIWEPEPAQIYSWQHNSDSTGGCTDFTGLTDAQRIQSATHALA